MKVKLENYRKEQKQEGLSEPIIENVENFLVLNDGVEFNFLYDYVVPISHREGTQKILKTATAEVEIKNNIPKISLYLIYAPSKIAEGVRLRLSRILSGLDDFIEEIDIPPDVLKNIEENDSIEIKYGWWDNIETYAKKGALKGNLSRSKYYSDFESSGQPILITFESRSVGRTIRVSAQGIITFYGKDVKKHEINEYITTFIIPRLKI